MTAVPQQRKDRAALSIVGVGAVTGYGFGVGAMMDGMASGASAVKAQDYLTEALGQTTYAAVVPPGPDAGASRYSQALAAAVDEAVTDATKRGWEPSGPVAVVNGTVLADVDAAADFYRRDARPWRPRRYLDVMPSTAISSLMGSHGFFGPSLGVTAMCASGNMALLIAEGLLASGAATSVIVTTADLSAQALHLEQFASVGVLRYHSPAFDVCRPFQADTSGYAFGEAVSAMVCTTDPAGAYATMLGGASTSDAHHPFSIDASLTQLRRCWEQAFAHSGVDPAEVAYLNAHAPGTRQSERAETTLFHEFFTPATRAYSLKPLLGHCQSAAAGVELVAMCVGYETGKLAAPPVFGPTSVPTLDGVSPYQPGLTAKSSIGMGGHNTMTIFSPPA